MTFKNFEKNIKLNTIYNIDKYTGQFLSTTPIDGYYPFYGVINGILDFYNLNENNIKDKQISENKDFWFDDCYFDNFSKLDIFNPDWKYKVKLFGFTETSQVMSYSNEMYARTLFLESHDMYYTITFYNRKNIDEDINEFLPLNLNKDLVRCCKYNKDDININFDQNILDENINVAFFSNLLVDSNLFIKKLDSEEKEKECLIDDPWEEPDFDEDIYQIGCDVYLGIDLDENIHIYLNGDNFLNVSPNKFISNFFNDEILQKYLKEEFEINDFICDFICDEAER